MTASDPKRTLSQVSVNMYRNKMRADFKIRIYIFNVINTQDYMFKG